MRDGVGMFLALMLYLTNENSLNINHCPHYMTSLLFETVKSTPAEINENIIISEGYVLGGHLTFPESELLLIPGEML